MKFEIFSIFSKIKEEQPTSIAILCQKLQARTEWEDAVKVTRYKVEDSVALFESILSKDGIHCVTISVAQLEEQRAEVLACDMCIIAGDTYYQLFRWGRELADRGYTKSVYLQILKDEAGKDSSARMAVTQASKYKVIHLLSSLVYLTKGRTEPREIYFHIPEEFPAVEASAVEALPSFQEGRIRTAISNIYERSTAARKACIEVHGLNCVVCGFDFERAYGSRAKGLIHVHHLNQLAGVSNIRSVNPQEDLRPVCPNCHMFIHSRSPMYSIQEVKDAIASENR